MSDAAPPLMVSHSMDANAGPSDNAVRASVKSSPCRAGAPNYNAKGYGDSADDPHDLPVDSGARSEQKSKSVAIVIGASSTPNMHLSSVAVPVCHLGQVKGAASSVLA